MDCKPKQRVRTFGEDSQRVRTFVKIVTKSSKGFALLAKVRKGFALLGKASMKTRKGLHFWPLVWKGSRFSAFFGLVAKGSQFLHADGTKQKQRKSGDHFCRNLPS